MDGDQQKVSDNEQSQKIDLSLLFIPILLRGKLFFRDTAVHEILDGITGCGAWCVGGSLKSLLRDSESSKKVTSVRQLVLKVSYRLIICLDWFLVVPQGHYLLVGGTLRGST